jgi:hypothetical protein
MKRFSQFLALVLVAGAGVGAALANASTHASKQASSANAPEPRLGNWKSTGGFADQSKLQVQRVKTETQIDNGTHVTVMREDYFRLTDFRFSDYIDTYCGNRQFSDVRIGSDGRFHVERNGVTLRGEVLNPTTIKLEMVGCRHEVVPVDLHPVR